MQVAKRSGPDFLFLANAHSQKFDDIEKNKITNIYFHDSATQDWISITGESVTSSSDDPRIKKVYTEGTKAWFGDLGDGKHNGGPEDPRMKLIEVHAKCML
jgi:general stress protein 26